MDPNRVYTDKLSGTSTRNNGPGLAALMDCGRCGDAIVVVGIDRVGRNAAEVMTTIRELSERGIVLRSLREGTLQLAGNPTGSVYQLSNGGEVPEEAFVDRPAEDREPLL
ncbi:MAG: pinR [Mycobacterium sp.]|nr:pinR [Mycobacterium sp.]